MLFSYLLKSKTGSADKPESALCFLSRDLLNQYALISHQHGDKLPGVVLDDAGRTCGFEEVAESETRLGLPLADQRAFFALQHSGRFQQSWRLAREPRPPVFV
jgi:hypothetical protein